MNLSALIYATLFLLLGTEMSTAMTDPVMGDENGPLMSLSSDDQRIGPFAVPLGVDGGVEPASHGQIANNDKTVKNHLLSQQEFPLLIADHFPRLSAYSKLPSSKYLLKPIRELSVANSNSLLNRADEIATARARRYAYPSQGFLRFGRRYKRPRDAKDTAFLRFGRSRTDNVAADKDNGTEGNDAVSRFL